MPRAKQTATPEIEVQEPVSKTTVAKTATEKAVIKSPLPDVVFLRKINKLGNLDKLGKPVFYGQTKFKPESDSREDVKLDFTGNSIPGSFRNITPQWDKLNNKWAWYGEYSDLTRIAKRLKLRDANQAIIEPEPYCFENREDPFFGHLKLWTNRELLMKDGKITLETNDPLHEFYARCYYGNPDVQNKLKVQSKSVRAGAELEIWSPKAETKAKKADIDKTDDSIVALKTMSIERQRLVAQIMRPAGFDPKNEDTELLYIQLREGAAMNEVKNDNRFGGMTWQDRFLQLADVDDTELFVMARIIDAKYKGALIYKKGTFHFLAKPLYADGSKEVKDEIDLINYFRRQENDPQFQKLSEWLEANQK